MSEALTTLPFRLSAHDRAVYHIKQYYRLVFGFPQITYYGGIAVFPFLAYAASKRFNLPASDWLGGVVISALIFVMTWLILVPVINLGCIYLSKHTRRDALKNNTVCISVEGIRIVTDEIDLNQKWSSFRRVWHSPGALYCQNMNFSAYLIPDRAFDTAEQAKAFSDAAISFWKAARDTKAA